MNSRKTKRLSGAEYRKKKIKKEEEKKALSNALTKCFETMAASTTGVSTSTADNVDPSGSRSSGLSSSQPHIQFNIPTSSLNDDSDDSDDQQSCRTPVSSFNELEEVVENLSSNDSKMENVSGTENEDLSIISDDPGLWPFTILQKDKDYLARKGPIQILDENFGFPCDDSGRKFTLANYYRNLANGEKIIRDWLVYSKSLDSVYCFPCKLFAISMEKGASSLVDKNGCSDWIHLSRVLSRHEISHKHIVNHNLWKNWQKSLISNTVIDATAQKLFQSAKEYWKNILKRIISIILFLAGQNLAFRGSSSRLYVHNNGNFLKTVELLAKYDKTLEEHLNKIKASDSKLNIHYLGHVIQNELIQIIADQIRCKIVAAVKAAKYFAVILDCTPDKNKKEQMTILLRYLNLDNIEIQESFIEFCPVTETTGLNLTEVIISKLEELGLDIQDLRGQSYDNGANMRGKNVGVQKRILDINSRAMFVPCAAHTLNLVINDAVKTTFDAVNFFSLIHNIYLFFSASTQRWAIFKSKVANLTLKPLSETRWESRVDSVRALRYQIGEIYDALISVINTQSFEAGIKCEANGIAQKIKSFHFLVCLVFWYDILNKINPVSKLLQNEKLNIVEATKALDALRDHFEKMRNDNCFQQLLVDAGELATELEIEAVFTNDVRARPRKKSRQFVYEGADEPIEDLKQKCKVDVFFAVLDTIYGAIQERFEQLKKHSDFFSFLYDLPLLTKLNQQDITKNCMDLHNYLSDTDKHDINGLELRDEISSMIVIMSGQTENFETPQKTLNYHLEGCFPNLYISLRILLTLPVSVATGERSFSKLKIIENYLRSSMSQERLNGLALISIEHEIANNLDMENIIDKFAEKKARKFW